MMARIKTPFILRRAEFDDAEAIFEVHRASVAGLCANHYSAEQLTAWIGGFDPEIILDILSTESIITYVVQWKNSIVGFAALQGQVIRAIYVHPKKIRQGVGTVLMKALEREAVLRLKPSLHVFASLNAKSFYEINGFRVIEKDKYPLNETQYLDCLKMEKSLIDQPLAS